MSAMHAMLIVAAALLALVHAPAVNAAELQLFDAHIHYSQPDWNVVPVDRALAILRDAGVKRAIVSSTPDDGTVKLYEKAPDVVVPFLRPYRTRADRSHWMRDPAVQTYVEERLERGIYRGIGEFHMDGGPADADGAVIRRFAEIGAERGLMLHAHVDAATIERLATLYPKTRFIWAHAGFAGADVVGPIVDRFPNVWVEMALNSPASGGTLDAAWAKLFTRHADRFMLGTDTWVTSRWESVGPGMRDYRAWLAQLPADVAEKIAWKNGERLFPPGR
ncbi:MAG: amidohydrolase family protein [Candidatus Rokubacteria bacterium]|nr:amidohydrolase family protein [Candidatus Rokubacteria bacterium]